MVVDSHDKKIAFGCFGCFSKQTIKLQHPKFASDRRDDSPFFCLWSAFALLAVTLKYLSSVFKGAICAYYSILATVTSTDVYLPAALT